MSKPKRSERGRKRKICVITGTRAEYGVMKSLLQQIRSSSVLSLQLVVTGMHLLDGFGNTIKQIKKDGFPVSATLAMYSGKEDRKEMAEALGKAIVGFARVFDRLKPDILLLEADRMEMLAAGLASLSFHIPIVHISGGDVSGGLDDVFRHALTRMSHFHLPNTAASAERLKNMGEEPWRIKNVGTLAVSEALLHEAASPADLQKNIGLNPARPFFVVLQHPVAAEADTAARQMRQTLEAVASLNEQTVLIYPNCDLGCEGIIAQIKRYRKTPKFYILQNVERSLYLGLIKHATVLLGNSSSGIVETPFFGTAVINIGTRQDGREQADNVINVGYSKNEIVDALKRLAQQGYTKIYSGNPYKDLQTEQRIVCVLETLKLDEKLMNKRLVL